MNPATTPMGGLTVIIPSLRRPHTLHETVASLLRQTAPPEEIILVVPDLTHVDAATLAAPRVRAIPSPVGACHQRNAGIRARNRAHPFVAFFDDDVELHPRYLEAARAALRADQDAVLLTGLVLRDGAKTGGIGRAAALATIAAASPIATELVTAVRAAYGCNMVCRSWVLDQEAFDEALPGYAWMEDLDFSLRVARLGGIVACAACLLVHLAEPRGRSSGVPLGYSQIVNPFYIMQKGTGLSLAEVVGAYWWPVLSKNLMLAFRAPRRERLLGNLRGLVALLTGHPHRPPST